MPITPTEAEEANAKRIRASNSYKEILDFIDTLLAAGTRTFTSSNVLASPIRLYIIEDYEKEEIGWKVTYSYDADEGELLFEPAPILQR